jgi:hypothetical protein
VRKGEKTARFDEVIQIAKFQIKPRRSRRGTHDMIMTMAKYGNHYIKGRYGHPFKTEADVKRYFDEGGWDYRDVVEECRDKDENVPFLENLIGSGYEVNSDGGRVSYVDKAGEETGIGEGDGWGHFNYPSYMGLFEQAIEDFNRCLDSARYGDFLSCVSNGVASIEAYLNQEVRVHNKRNPRKEFIDDKHNKVSFVDRVDQWIPIMTGGKKLNKGNQRWEHFKRLRAIRDGNQAHVKVPVLGANHRQLGELLNHFRSGIAGMLLELHILFDDRATPAAVIRYAYLPDVEYLVGEAQGMHS